ncbi:MAG: DUF3089 domain-containing protein [Pseudomonadota bacterium]
MKKILLGLAALIVLLALVAYLNRGPLLFMLMASQIAPAHDFGSQPPPPAPDYTGDQHWAALPSLTDPSDQRPQGVQQDLTDVAVFFVHPTSYFGKTWNQPLQDAAANWVVDERVLRHQASVFNGCCDIYAPRYRQATFFSFMDQADNGEQALQLAYGDVRAAFDAFLTRIGNRPFIIAGHSQGSRHATQLVREQVTGTPLQARLVAAYLVGFSVTHAQLAELPACDQPGAHGCALGWNVMDGHGDGAFGNNPGLLCTNPLNWRVDGAYAGHEANLGAIGFVTYGQAGPDEDVASMHLEVGIADAECAADGQLAVLDLKSDSFPARMFNNSMHVYDYSLFHMNIRANLAQQIASFNAASR